METSARPRVAALALAVGVVLADSSIVVLALPEIYRELDTSVAGVTWVLISFNLVMALAAVPAALLARRVGPGRAAAVGLAVFAGAGLACGLADELSTLIAARCVQALGGALAVTAALELLPATVGSERRAATVWAAAGATGAALGPALGGLLTELVSWQSIFLLQVPVALVAAVPILTVARDEMATGVIEPELRVQLGLQTDDLIKVAVLHKGDAWGKSSGADLEKAEEFFRVYTRAGRSPADEIA